MSAFTIKLGSVYGFRYYLHLLHKLDYDDKIRCRDSKDL